MSIEDRRNEDRFHFIEWTKTAFKNVDVIPAGNGIMHQINLEKMSPVIQARGGVAFPDTCVGTDSHTPHVDALGVIAIGVGGLEAENVMLGRASWMRLPEIVGVELKGRPQPGITATDVVLALTEFLRNNAPSAENDLMLRVRQIELLSAAGLMEEIIQSPISIVQLLPATTATNNENSPPRRVSPETRFATEAITQARTLAESLLTQIEEVRREVDRDAIRAAREQTRMVLTDVAFVRYRLADAKESKKLREEAETLIEQMQKTTSDDWLRFRCRVMLAEIQLDLNDFDTFKLRYGTTQAAANSQTEKASTAALKIRSLLQQGLPSEALQEYVEASKNGLALTQELQTLRLEGLLQLLELLYQLQHWDQQ
jgi:hypothetical protein